jgi:hypothetical protein
MAMLGIRTVEASWTPAVTGTHQHVVLLNKTSRGQIEPLPKIIACSIEQAAAVLGHHHLQAVAVVSLTDSWR